MEEEKGTAAVEQDAAAPEPSPSQLGNFKKRIHSLCDSDTGDFDAWVSLISAAEETAANDIEVISLVYRSFLLEFPLCYGYWIKYAAHKARLSTCEDVMDVYEQAVQAIPHSVDLWVSYCGFGICAYDDPAHIRSVFERALSLVGKDYLCYHLWDKYIEFENSQKHLIQLATIYINTLKFPTKKLRQYYESFKKLVTLLEEVIHCDAETLSESGQTYEVTVREESEGDISTKIAGLFDQKYCHLTPRALKQYLFAGECLYQKSSKIDEEICCFEASIKRPFFHVKPLDDDQLENWHRYLDFVEKNGDFDWAVKLYERCLIPCANYSEFWIRYAEFVDAKGGREIANYALRRASSCFVKGVPIFSMYYAMFKEQIGDAPGARSLFVKGSSNFTSDFCMNINRLANMEKRMGNTKSASEIYETAIEDAMQNQNIEILPDLYTNFAQFKYAASHSIGEAKEIFVKGIKQAPCKPLITGFIHFMSTHGGPTEIPLLDSVISNAVIPGSDISTALSTKDREDISLLFMEFVDLYGGVTELKKAWARHSKLFPYNTRNLSQRYRATESSVQENKKRKRTESMNVSPVNSPEDKVTLKQSSKRDTCSLVVDKEAESQVDRNTVGSGKGHRDAEHQNILWSIDAHQEVGDAAKECVDMAHSKNSLGKSGIENRMNSDANQEICYDLSLCKQNEQATKFHPASSEKAPQAESCKSDSPSKSIAGSKEINAQDKGKITEVSSSGHLGKVRLTSDPPSGSSSSKEGSLSNPAQISLVLEEVQQEKIQVKLETEHDVSVSNVNPEKSSDSTDAIQCGREISSIDQDHIQSSQSQQLSVCAKPSSSEIVTTQSTTCPNFSPNTAMTSQAEVHDQMANSQMYQSMVGQNMQQQGVAYATPQNAQTPSQTQVQPFAHANQGNQQYLQMMQGYASQMWKYYQQQMYYLQAKYNQQMQSLQQQQLPTEHLQQNLMQQVQQLNQQMVLWQQQVQQQQQQQQAQPVQQQSDDKQGHHHSSSGDNKHEQNEQQKQEPQMDYQSQHVQQQQILYFQQQQQQQQQQMSLIQQQQMYQQQQQQQLMQQQMLQTPQQHDLAQQQLFQQQQQQLYQQQQQQMILLQQQQQQLIQQQMQQHERKKINQEGFKDRNRELNHQDARSWPMEHGQQSETSQSDGSKLRSAEQSELSYPSTPQSQRSHH